MGDREKFINFLADQLSDLHTRVSAEYLKCTIGNSDDAISSERKISEEIVASTKLNSAHADSNGAKSWVIDLDKPIEDSKFAISKSVQILLKESGRNVRPTLPHIKRPSPVDTQSLPLAFNSESSKTNSPLSPRRWGSDDGMEESSSRRNLRKTTTSKSPKNQALVDAVAAQAKQEFVTCPAWREDPESDNLALIVQLSKARSGNLETKSMTQSVASDLKLNDENESRVERKMRRLCGRIIVHPNSRKRLCWDLVGMLLICYDLIMIPLGIFEMDRTTFEMVFALVSLWFWTLDLPSNFFVGYHKGGSLITSPMRIALRYIFTWLFLDLLLVTIDWSIFLMPDDDDDASEIESFGLARLGKTIRVMRVLRILRLLRLIKLPRYFLRVEEHIQSESVVVIIGVTKLTACVLVINHFIACLWYWVGTLPLPANSPGQQMGWVESWHITNATGLYRYTTSLHWSLTQFTPASMEVHPGNVNERTFTIVVLVFAMVTFSSFVSSITNAMTQLRNMNSDYMKQLVVFQRYIRYHKISTSLSVRMRRHLERRLLRDRNIEEKDVQMLRVLSEPLRMELHLEVFRPILARHLFFACYERRNSMGMRKLCHNAIGEVALSRGDLLFSSGETCQSMMFLVSGVMRYSLQFNLEGDYEKLKSGDYLSEACLWTPWLHCGQAAAETTSVGVSLNADKFHQVARTSHSLIMLPSRYAEAFVICLNSLSPEELTDLHFEEFDIQAAVDACCTLTDLSPDTNHMNDSPGYLASPRW